MVLFSAGLTILNLLGIELVGLAATVFGLVTRRHVAS